MGGQVKARQGCLRGNSTLTLEGIQVYLTEVWSVSVHSCTEGYKLTPCTGFDKIQTEAKYQMSVLWIPVKAHFNQFMALILSMIDPTVVSTFCALSQTRCPSLASTPLPSTHGGINFLFFLSTRRCLGFSNVI